MNKASYQKYLLTPHWRATAKKAIKRAGNRCQVCGNVYRLHVHHNTYRNLGKEKPQDLCVLCSRCHALFHDIIDAPRRPKVRKEVVRMKARCPTCKARPGSNCVTIHGVKRKANHVARIDTYLNM